MLIVLYVLVVALVLFGAAVVATHDSAGLAEAPADRADVGLPEGVLQPEDLAQVRFGMVLRGYRMAEVDDSLARVGAELAARDTRIRELEQALVDVVAPLVEDAEAAEERWTPADPPAAPVVTLPSLFALDQVVVSDPQTVAGPSRIPPLVRPWLPTSVPSPDAEEPPAAVDGPVPDRVPEPAPPPADPPVEPAAPYGELDDRFPEVLAPEPAAPGAPEATDITLTEDIPTGDARSQD